VRWTAVCSHRGELIGERTRPVPRSRHLSMSDRDRNPLGSILSAAMGGVNASVMATKTKKNQGQVSSPVSHVRSTPIGEYGFLSDGEVSALMSPSGAVEWMCIPRFDSP